MKSGLLLLIIVTFGFGSCHPCYKRLTKGNWGKDTTWVKFPDLPEVMTNTLVKYYEATFTKDTSDDMSDLISFEPNEQFTDVANYDAYSPKLRLPFGRYFKIGKKKYFIYYSDLRAPLLYYNTSLYFPAGAFFDENTSSMHSQFERWAYNKTYFVKYDLNKKRKVK